MSTDLNFSTYITERTRDFVGREWVFAEIDQWLACGGEWVECGSLDG